MQTTLLIHIVAGGLALLSGAVALAVTKGASLHRRSGWLFVLTMVAMSTLGAAIAAVKGTEGSVIAGVLTAYLVVTALTAVRPPAVGARGLEVGAMIVALAVAVAGLGFGVQAIAGGVRVIHGIPTPMFLMFGTVALLSGVSDARVIRAGGIYGVRRLARHLWRMCFAMWIATASFFLGQADKFPTSLRHPAVLVPPVVIVLVVMAYWFWRVRVRGSVRGLVLGGHEVARKASPPPLAARADGV